MHFMRFVILASIAFAVAHVHVCLVNGVAFAINAADRMPAAANRSIPVVATVTTALVATETIVIKYPSGFITQATANCMSVAVGISTAAVGAYTVTLAGDSLGRIVSESASFSATMHSPGTGGYPAFGGQVTSMPITDIDHIPVVTSSASSTVPATVSLGVFLVTFVMTRCRQRTAIKVSRALNGCVARFHLKFAFSLLRIIVDSFRVHVAALATTDHYLHYTRPPPPPVPSSNLHHFHHCNNHNNHHNDHCSHHRFRSCHFPGIKCFTARAFDHPAFEAAAALAEQPDVTDDAVLDRYRRRDVHRSCRVPSRLSPSTTPAVHGLPSASCKSSSTRQCRLLPLTFLFLAMSVAFCPVRAESAWTTAEMSVARGWFATASVGNMALFAGGYDPSGSALLWNKCVWC